MRSSLVHFLTREAVEIELSTGSPEGVLKLAEAMYIALAKRYHPDRNSNPVANDFFRQCTEDIEDLRDPDGLSLAIEYLLGGGELGRSFNSAESRKATLAQIRKADEKTSAALGMLRFVDSRKVLRIDDAPMSFLLAGNTGSSRLVLEVEAQKARLLAVDLSTDFTPTGKQDGSRFLSLYWQETNEYKSGYLDDDSVEAEERVVVYDSLTVLAGDVSVIGYVPVDVSEEVALSVDSGSFAALDSGRSAGLPHPIEWLDPQTCWFVPYLTSEPFSRRTGGAQSPNVLVVSDARGRLALAGSIVNSAVMSSFPL